MVAFPHYFLTVCLPSHPPEWPRGHVVEGNGTVNRSPCCIHGKGSIITECVKKIEGIIIEGHRKKCVKNEWVKNYVCAKKKDSFAL